MECKDVEYNIIDFIDKQLSPEKELIIEKHIVSCGECKIAYDETLVLMRDFENENKETPSTNLRTNFYTFLEEEKQLQEAMKIVQLNPESSFNWKYAFQIAASVVLLLTGYFAGNFATKQNANEEIVALKMQTVELKENMMLALLDNNSASKRIQAVNYSGELEQPDEKITIALIDRMHFDSNINVRLAAAEALSKYSEIELVKKAFIDALSTENDPSLQIAIIQFLVQTQEKRALDPMQQLLEQPETPDYVKAEVSSGMSQII